MMYKKILIITMTIIISLLIFSGCWSRKEPKSLAVVTSVIYDVSDNDNYIITFEILDPIKATGTNNGKGSTIIHNSEGKTIADAYANINTTLSRQLFGGSNKARFLTEKFAEEKITNAMDIFLRDHFTNERPLLLIIKSDDPKRIYQADIGLSNIAGVFVENLTKSQLEASSFTVYISTLDYIKDELCDGKQPVMGLVEIIDNPLYIEDNKDTTAPANTFKKYIPIFEGLSVMKDDKVVGYMNKYDARAYNYLVNKVLSTYISVMVDGDYYSANLSKSKAKIKTRYENNVIFADISVKQNMMLAQNEGVMDPSKPENIKILEEAFAEQVKKELYHSINTAQGLRSDIFGFGEYFHMEHPKEWKTMKKTWDDDYFPSIIVNVKVEVNVNRDGETILPYGSKSDE